MAITYESVRIKGETVTPDLLIWRRYKSKAPGILEQFLDRNPQVHAALEIGPYLPRGVVVEIPVDSDLVNGRPSVVETIKLYGAVQ